MSIFNIGDEVKLKDNLILGEKYNIFMYEEFMAKHQGEVFKITGVCPESVCDRGMERYYYIVSGHSSYYVAEMLEFAIKFTKKQRKTKIDKIIKEIKANKDYSECFEDIDKEVNSWSDSKIERW